MGREPPQWGPEGWSPGHCAVLREDPGEGRWAEKILVLVFRVLP